MGEGHALERRKDHALEASKNQGADAPRSPEPIVNAVRWLLDVQNRDGGFPTFCRGWGTLPFDRSSADITAHCLRGLSKWNETTATQAIDRGFKFLKKKQRPDGSWLPLWFGNQHAPHDENATYGTARVLAAYRDCNRIETHEGQRGLEWLKANQNDDGGWGGVKGVASSVEETALAAEILLSVEPNRESAQRGLAWLLDRIDDDSYREPTPIGFYFAKLWYFERLYPLSLMVAALRTAVRQETTPR